MIKGHPLITSLVLDITFIVQAGPRYVDRLVFLGHRLLLVATVGPFMLAAFVEENRARHCHVSVQGSLMNASRRDLWIALPFVLLSIQTIDSGLTMNNRHFVVGRRAVVRYRPLLLRVWIVLIVPHVQICIMLLIEVALRGVLFDFV